LKKLRWFWMEYNEILRLRDFEILRLRDFEILGFWDFGTKRILCLNLPLS